jgi:hypothetical protein
MQCRKQTSKSSISSSAANPANSFSFVRISTGLPELLTKSLPTKLESENEP